MQIFKCGARSESIDILGSDAPEVCALLFCKLSVLLFLFQKEHHWHWHLPLGMELLMKNTMILEKEKNTAEEGVGRWGGGGNANSPCKDCKECEGEFCWSSGKLPAVGEQNVAFSESWPPSQASQDGIYGGRKFRNEVERKCLWRTTSVLMSLSPEAARIINQKQTWTGICMTHAGHRLQLLHCSQTQRLWRNIVKVILAKITWEKRQPCPQKWH